MDIIAGYSLELLFISYIACLVLGLPCGLYFLIKYKREKSKKLFILGVVSMVLFIVSLGVYLYFSISGIPLIDYNGYL